jgi:hypothetical protein
MDGPAITWQGGRSAQGSPDHWTLVFGNRGSEAAQISRHSGAQRLRSDAERIFF